ncbi:MAG: TMEM175 family protein [Pirellulales bacterium]
MSDDAWDTERMEYFSDAVIAIVATLLVVDLKPPRSENLAGATLRDALAHDSPNFVAFAVSFVFIGIAWAAHHDMFRYIRRTNHVLLILNLIFLMAIALQPFSTALVAEHYGKPDERTAALVYYGILFSASLSYNAVWWYAVQGGLVSEDLDPQLLRTLSLEHIAAPVLHAVALVVASWSVPLSFIPLSMVYLLFTLPRVTEKWAAKHPRG